MTTSSENTAPLNALELLESARSKYTLAMSRARHGPPELALLSLHGSLEDALRAHGLGLHLPAAHEPFPVLLEALVGVDQTPLSRAEADGIKRMHRLRARVAHGEQIAVTRETIDAYHRLTARLLPRYGIVVITPEAPPPAATATTVPGRRGDTALMLSRETPDTRRRGDTAALDRNLAPGPRRERTVYPDDKPARYAGRAMPSAATRDLPLAREMLATNQLRRSARRPDLLRQLEDFWWRSQAWLLPALIVLGILLIGLVISASLQMQTAPVAPTAAINLPTSAAPPLATAPPAPDSSGAIGTPAPGALPADPALVATAAPGAASPSAAPGELAVGRVVYVRGDAEALNVRARPGTGGDNPIQVTLTPGTAAEIIGGPVRADGFTWWQVRAAGAEGWCAGQWLEVR